MRKIYQFIFNIFGKKTPEKCSKFRYFLVKKYICSAGKNLSIGRYSRIHKNTIIGNNSGIGYGCEINNGVIIGNDVMMGPDVVIYTNNHCTDRIDIPMREQGMKEINPVNIEDDVWIGARVIILPGVTIGKGSVIGAGAVVSKSIPPYSVAVGNPAVVVKERKNS